MNQDQAMAYLAANHRGVLATLKRDGRPQLSHVAYMLDDDGMIKISVTTDRAKTRWKPTSLGADGVHERWATDPAPATQEGDSTRQV